MLQQEERERERKRTCEKARTVVVKATNWLNYASIWQSYLDISSIIIFHTFPNVHWLWGVKEDETCLLNTLSLPLCCFSPITIHGRRRGIFLLHLPEHREASRVPDEGQMYFWGLGDVV